MKFKALQLAGWFYLSYLFYSPLRDYLQYWGASDLFTWVFDKQEFILMATTLTSFFTYTLATYAILFYTHRKRRFVLMGVLLFLMIPAVAGFRYVLQEVLQEAIFGFGNYTPNYGAANYFFDNLYYALFFPWVGGIFYFIQYSKFKDRQQQELMIQSQQTQLSLLRSQINPHFLFNSLNNIYSLVYTQSDQSLKAVETLSGLLRYSLYEQADRVPLEREVKYLHDFIALERMRHDYTIALEIAVAENVQDLRIAPFLIIPFIENVFKHGLLNDPAQAIRIELYRSEQDLVFTISNTIAQHQKDEMGGIGLENVKQRLALLYGEDHTLVVRKEEGRFYVELKIALEQC